MIAKTWPEWAQEYQHVIRSADGFRDNPQTHLYTRREYCQRVGACTMLIRDIQGPDEIPSVSPSAVLDAERLKNRRALEVLHPGNRLRLMFGLPLLSDE